MGLRTIFQHPKTSQPGKRGKEGKHPYRLAGLELIQHRFPKDRTMKANLLAETLPFSRISESARFASCPLPDLYSPLPWG